MSVPDPTHFVREAGLVFSVCVLESIFGWFEALKGVD
jgi:hypothetical protein